MDNKSLCLDRSPLIFTSATVTEFKPTKSMPRMTYHQRYVTECLVCTYCNIILPSTSDLILRKFGFPPDKMSNFEVNSIYDFCTI